jgi:methylmalonyl-CoA/ethylmalonyl-CoA epimerase
MTFTRIDHVGIAVDDLEAAVARYRELLGSEPVHRETVADQGVDEVLFAIGESYLQLRGARGPGTPVAGFLAKRGPGMHHVAYRVDDLEAELAALRAAGAQLVDETPRRGSRNTLTAFVHPHATGGVLVELVQERSADATGP